MFKNPFVWKSLHLALLAAKDEQIQSLREDLYVARADRLRAETGRDVAVKQTIEALTPKPVVAPAPPRFIRRDQAEPERPTKIYDLAEVDPNAKAAIRDIALSRMSKGKQSGGLFLATMEGIRQEILLAQVVKSEKAKQVGVISAPESVMAKIEAAEQEGKERARVN